MNVNRNNCLNCLVRPMLILTSACYYPLLISCPHSTKYTSSIEIKVSLLLLLTCIAKCLIIVAKVAFYSRKLYFSEFKNPTSAAAFATEILLSASTIVVVLSAAAKTKQKVLELKGLVTVIQNRHIFGVHHFFDKEAVKLLALVSYGSIGTICAVVFACIASQSLGCGGSSSAVSTFESFIQLSVSFSNIFFNVLYSVMFKACYQRMEYVLNIRAKTGNKVLMEGSQKITTDRFLKKSVRLHLSLMHNYSEFNELLNPSFIIYVLTTVAMLIISVYIVTNTPNYSEFEDTLVVVRSIVAFLITCIFFISSQKVSTSNQDILSFIFKYPISKLDKEEAAQVEAIIKALIIYKPVLRISNIFNLRTSLIASMSGTILTYALVAMQFRAPELNEE